MKEYENTTLFIGYHLSIDNNDQREKHVLIKTMVIKTIYIC